MYIIHTLFIADVIMDMLGKPQLRKVILSYYLVSSHYADSVVVVAVCKKTLSCTFGCQLKFIVDHLLAYIFLFQLWNEW